MVLSAIVAKDGKARAFLYAELAKFAHAGFGIDKACESILEQSRSDATAREICRAILEGTRAGKSMADSLATEEQFPISDLEIAMLDAAERGGQLERGFRHLAEHFRQEEEARRRIRRALIYPLVVLHLALFVGIGMTTVMGALGASLSGWNGGGESFDWKASLLTSLAWVAVGYGIAILVIVAWRHFSKAACRSASVEAALQRIPLAGPVREARGLARFCEVLHLYLLSGQRMDLGWEKAGQASQSGRLREYSAKTAPLLAAGESVGTVAGLSEGALPSDLVRGLASADLAGALDRETAQWAETYRQTSAENVERLAEWAPKFFYWMVLIFAGWMIIRAALSYFGMLNNLGNLGG